MVTALRSRVKSFSSPVLWRRTVRVTEVPTSPRIRVVGSMPEVRVTPSTARMRSPGGQPGLLSGGIVQDGQNLDSVVHRVLERHADSHHRLAVHLIQEGLVLLRRHIYGVGVVQGLQNGLSGVQIQNLLWNLIHIVGLQQRAGVFRLQGRGGESAQAESQGGGQQAGKNAVFHGSLLFWISRAPDATGIRRRTYDYSFEVR